MADGEDDDVGVPSPRGGDPWGILGGAAYLCSKIMEKPGFAFKILVEVREENPVRERQGARAAPRVHRGNAAVAPPVLGCCWGDGWKVLAVPLCGGLVGRRIGGEKRNRPRKRKRSILGKFQQWAWVDSSSFHLPRRDKSHQRPICDRRPINQRELEVFEASPVGAGASMATRHSTFIHLPSHEFLGV